MDTLWFPVRAFWLLIWRPLAYFGGLLALFVILAAARRIQAPEYECRGKPPPAFLKAHPELQRVYDEGLQTLALADQHRADQQERGTYERVVLKRPEGDLQGDLQRTMVDRMDLYNSIQERWLTACQAALNQRSPGGTPR